MGRETNCTSEADQRCEETTDPPVSDSSSRRRQPLPPIKTVLPRHGDDLISPDVSDSPAGASRFVDVWLYKPQNY